MFLFESFKPSIVSVASSRKIVSMQPASSSSAARFHENGDVDDSRRNDYVSVVSSFPGDSEDESEVRSMTAKGINHLCSELLELKAESNGDFHRIIISSCLSFSRTFEEVKVMQQDLIQLKSHISTQTNLVKYLVDGIDLVVEADETEQTVDSTLQPSEFSKISCLVDLESRIYSVSESLDTLVCENRIDEALEVVKIEDENLQRVKVEEDYPIDIVMLYDCVISDKKAKIKLRLAQASDNTETHAGGEIVPTTDRPPSISSPTSRDVSVD